MLPSSPSLHGTVVQLLEHGQPRSRAVPHHLQSKARGAIDSLADTLAQQPGADLLDGSRHGVRHGPWRGTRSVAWTATSDHSAPGQWVRSDTQRSEGKCRKIAEHCLDILVADRAVSDRLAHGHKKGVHRGEPVRNATTPKKREDQGATVIGLVAATGVP